MDWETDNTLKLTVTEKKKGSSKEEEMMNGDRDQPGRRRCEENTGPIESLNHHHQKVSYTSSKGR